MIDLGGVKLEMQIGPVGARAFEPKRGAGRGHVARGSDPDGLGRKAGPGNVEDLIVDREKPPRVVDDEFPGRSEADAGRALVEEVGTQKALQSLDLRADGRLR